MTEHIELHFIHSVHAHLPYDVKWLFLQIHMAGHMPAFAAEGLTHRNFLWIHAQLYLEYAPFSVHSGVTDVLKLHGRFHWRQCNSFIIKWSNICE